MIPSFEHSAHKQYHSAWRHWSNEVTPGYIDKNSWHSKPPKTWKVKSVAYRPEKCLETQHTYIQRERVSHMLTRINLCILIVSAFKEMNNGVSAVFSGDQALKWLFLEIKVALLSLVEANKLELKHSFTVDCNFSMILLQRVLAARYCCSV